MDKYIVEIDGKNICSDSDGKSKLALSVKADNGYAVFCTEIPLTPYTEPNLERVRKEAYKEGREAGIKDGKCEAWEASKKIINMSFEERRKIFVESLIQKIHSIYTASEAIEKIRQYEQEQEGRKQIQVGDEVKCIRAGWTAIVTKIKEDGYLTLMGNDGAIANGYDEKDFIKTGRCFHEIAEVFAKMKETDNG
jgi:hypothetical protein